MTSGRCSGACTAERSLSVPHSSGRASLLQDLRSVALPELLFDVVPVRGHAFEVFAQREEGAGPIVPAIGVFPAVATLLTVQVEEVGGHVLEHEQPTVATERTGT